MSRAELKSRNRCHKQLILASLNTGNADCQLSAGSVRPNLVRLPHAARPRDRLEAVLRRPSTGQVRGHTVHGDETPRETSQSGIHESTCRPQLGRRSPAFHGPRHLLPHGGHLRLEAELSVAGVAGQATSRWPLKSVRKIYSNQFEVNNDDNNNNNAAYFVASAHLTCSILSASCFLFSKLSFERNPSWGSQFINAIGTNSKSSFYSCILGQRSSVLSTGFFSQNLNPGMA